MTDGNPNAPSNDSAPAVAAIACALNSRTKDPVHFLRLWNEGEFEILRSIGADPLFKSEEGLV